MPREQQPSGVELQPNDRKALLARVIANSKPDDSAAQAAVKEVRKELKEVEDELHEKMEQMTKKHDDAIRQLSQKFEQMSQELKVPV
jgi:predicted nuclease with TOPRIM domain